MYLEAAQGFENPYGAGVVLTLVLLKRYMELSKQHCISGEHLNKTMGSMKYTHSKADPCLFYKRNKNNDLTIWIWWVEDLLTIGKPNVIEEAKKNVMIAMMWVNWKPRNVHD
jgi:hypothetical protein